MGAIPFPAIDPIAFEIGPFIVRWYALAYMAGFLAGWRYGIHLIRVVPTGPSSRDLDDFLIWAMVAVVLGGRIGYVLFYNLGAYLDRPLDILKLWEGGMSFHGGLLGMIAAMILFSLRRRISPLAFADIIAAVAPIGIFLGRLANFVNGELYGRVTEVPWAVVFPHGGDLARHPSQIYEALLEGLVLLILLGILAHKPGVRQRPGLITGSFLLGYGSSRFAVEFFREPDAQLEFLWLGTTTGQLLSLPMIFLGIGLIWHSCTRPPVVLHEH
jgi:phosphatidylglycerol:prolipoprotein diacylglycerol transferase